MKKYHADYILTSAKSSAPLPAFIVNGSLTADETTGNILSVEKIEKKRHKKKERGGGSSLQNLNCPRIYQRPYPYRHYF